MLCRDQSRSIVVKRREKSTYNLRVIYCFIEKFDGWGSWYRFDWFQKLWLFNQLCNRVLHWIELIQSAG